jgi:hypothetical protein
MHLSTALPDGQYLQSVLHRSSMISREDGVSYEAARLPTEQCAGYLTHPISNEAIFILAPHSLAGF